MASDLGLSLTQTNAVWSGAVVGQYASAAFIGSLADTYGPKPVSFLGAILFGAGYILMARTERNAILRKQTPQVDHDSTQQAAFVAMTAYFVLVGTGVAARYVFCVCVCVCVCVRPDESMES